MNEKLRKKESYDPDMINRVYQALVDTLPFNSTFADLQLKKSPTYAEKVASVEKFLQEVDKRDGEAKLDLLQHFFPRTQFPRDDTGFDADTWETLIFQ